MSDDESTVSVDQPGEDPRPPTNPIEMEAVRARAEAALFGSAAPPRLGRFHIIDRIAGGGMGLVYGAYDPELDRRVALKVVHPKRTHDERAQARLITEARALARLDHSNVVKVHDVLTHDGSVVIVMELVVGETLAAWANKPHTWRDAVRVYQQAARGLVAAHSVGVVHRDFKPSNAIIGADGRVRVLDFGLARFGESTEPRPSPGSPSTPDLTETGDILGTIAYASPEQLRGEPSTEASDQFSWCVSLHLAVEGLSPFTGTTIDARLASIEADGPALGKTDVPTWLRALIARGLSPRPTDRFPDMETLVAELVRPRGIRRFRTPLLVAGTLSLGIGATLALRGATNDDECDGGRDQLATAWNPTLRSALSRTLDNFHTPYARDVRDRVLAGLDHYASAWSTTHLAACRDHRKGATSATLLDRRMTCLEERLSDLRAATEVVQKTDPTSLSNVMDVVARMPPVARCSDLVRLQADVELPEGDQLREQVRGVRAKIAGAEALARAGRSEAARTAAADAVTAAAHTPYIPVQVEAALALSRTLMSFGELEGAIAPLTTARAAAIEQSMMPAAVEAGARLLYAENMLSASKPNIERDAAFLEPLARLRSCADFARPLLLNNLGTAFLSTGDRSRAHDYFEKARAALQTVVSPDLELTVVDRNLALLTDDDAKRTALTAGVVQRLRETLGPSHPATLEALSAAASFEIDPAKAYELARTSTDGYRAYHPALVRSGAIAEALRAFTAAELEDRERARADYRRAIARMGDDAELSIWRSLAIGELALLDGDSTAAERAFTQVRDARVASTAWWEREDLLRAEVGLGAAAIERDDFEGAIPHLEAAVTGLPSIIRLNENVVPRRLLARAQRLLAPLLRKRAQTERADALEREAHAFFERGPIGYRWLLRK